MRKINLSPTSKNLNKSIIFDTIFSIGIFAVMLIIISNPQKFTSGTINGLKLFFFSVLPGLFPFMILTKLLTEIGLLFKITSKMNKFSNKLFGTPGVSIYAFFMSILSGYPIGAKIISDLYQKQLISEEDAKRMSVFCTTSGPIFVIGAVGMGMFKSYKIGVILYFSHIVSSLVLGIIFNLLSKHKTSCSATIETPLKKENIISSVVSETINSLFVVGAYITIFYLITELLNAFNIIDTLTKFLSPFLSRLGISKTNTKGLIYGLIEVTRGAKELSQTFSPTSIALAAGILSFSGLSIIMQSLAFLKTCKIKAHSFVFAKCVHMILSILICMLVFIIIWNSTNFYVVDCMFKFITISFNNCKILV